jgi:putative hydrolase of the HAD superfamily
LDGTETPTGPRGVIVVVAGLIASGKSTVSSAIASRLGAARLEADRIRSTLLHAFDDDPTGIEARWRRDLSPAFEEEIYADLFRRAEELILAGESLVLDACFPLRRQREAARSLASKHGCRFMFVWCFVPDEVRQARLAERDRNVGHSAWALIDRRLASHYEPPEELEAHECLEVRSDGPVDPLIESIAERLQLHPEVPETRSSRDGVLQPRVVSFDCWGTLISEEDWHWAHTLRITALREAAREAGHEVSFEAAKAAFESAWHRHQELWHAARSSGAPEIAAWGLAELGIEDAAAARARLVRRFEEASHTGEVVALEGARDLLMALGRAGTPSVLVCDTGLTPGRVVRGLLDRHGLLEHLRVQAFSDEIGAPKPDPRPFRAAIEPLGVDPADVLHVGDLRRTDVAGARALGMQTVRIRARHDDDSDFAEADHVVDSHAELARLLGLPAAGIAGA